MQATRAIAPTLASATTRSALNHDKISIRRLSVVRHAENSDDAQGSAPPPGMDKASSTRAPEMQLTKKGAPMPKAQKPQKRKAKTGAPPPVKIELTEAEKEAEKKFDDIVAAGGAIFEVFIRAKGPNQWFPVGPMAVKNPRSIKNEIWAAEEPLKKAGFRMYPKLLAFPASGKVEYGYRERDEAKKMTEEDIRAGAGTKNPFDDVILLTRDDGVSTESDQGSILDKFKKMLNPYDK